MLFDIPLLYLPLVSARSDPGCSYQREIYPPEQFERKRMYGLPLMVTADKELKNYLNSVLTQLNGEHLPEVRSSPLAIPLPPPPLTAYLLCPLPRILLCY